MFNLVNHLGSPNSPRGDVYGVGDLLEEVYKHSGSISDQERAEIANICKRIRQNRHHRASVRTWQQQTTPDNSQHDNDGDGTPNLTRHRDFGRDLFKMDLFRGFGARTSVATASSPAEPLTVTPPPSALPVHTTYKRDLLRGFGPSSPSSADGHSTSNDSDTESSL